MNWNIFFHLLAYHLGISCDVSCSNVSDICRFTAIVLNVLGQDKSYSWWKILDFEMEFHLFSSNWNTQNVLSTTNIIAFNWGQVFIEGLAKYPVTLLEYLWERDCLGLYVVSNFSLVGSENAKSWVVELKLALILLKIQLPFFFLWHLSCTRNCLWICLCLIDM